MYLDKVVINTVKIYVNSKWCSCQFSETEYYIEGKVIKKSGSFIERISHTKGTLVALAIPGKLEVSLSEISIDSSSLVINDNIVKANNDQILEGLNKINNYPMIIIGELSEDLQLLILNSKFDIGLNHGTSQYN